MKNLIPLADDITYWDNIVRNKNLPNRISLQNIRQDVLDRFNIYRGYTNPNTLENIPSSSFLEPQISLLIGCYSQSKNLSTLKTKIKENQDMFLRSECQYCNINEPNTFDHYLPQVYFPEFSALSINLIPCCSNCNTGKGEEWLSHGNRKIINYYYDTIPNINYLDCSLIYKHDTPQAIFTIHENVLPSNIKDIIVSHFQTLNLLDRYSQRSNGEISSISCAIKPYVGKLTLVEIQNNLQIEVTQLKKKCGENYWRAILRIALLKSIRFLHDEGF